MAAGLAAGMVTISTDRYFVAELQAQQDVIGLTLRRHRPARAEIVPMSLGLLGIIVTPAGQLDAFQFAGRAEDTSG